MGTLPPDGMVIVTLSIVAFVFMVIIIWDDIRKN